MAAVALDSKLHALGGSTNGRAGFYHDEYDPAKDEWQRKAPLVEPRDHLAVAVANGEIYAFGGFATPVHKGASYEAFEYDPVRNGWRALPSMKVPRGAAGAAYGVPVNEEIRGPVRTFRPRACATSSPAWSCSC